MLGACHSDCMNYHVLVVCIEQMTLEIYCSLFSSSCHEYDWRHCKRRIETAEHTFQNVHKVISIRDAPRTCRTLHRKCWRKWFWESATSPLRNGSFTYLGQICKLWFSQQLTNSLWYHNSHQQTKMKFAASIIAVSVASASAFSPATSFVRVSSTLCIIKDSVMALKRKKYHARSTSHMRSHHEHLLLTFQSLVTSLRQV